MTTRIFIKILYFFSTILSGIGWGISIIGAFMPSKQSFEILASIVGEDVLYSRPMAYWLVMCSIGFTFIGMQFIFSLFKSFGNHYLIMGAFNLVCALGLLIFGVLNGFHMDVQIYDILFLLTTGLTIIISGRIYRVNLNKPFVAVK